MDVTAAACILEDGLKQWKCIHQGDCKAAGILFGIPQASKKTTSWIARIKHRFQNKYSVKIRGALVPVGLFKPHFAPVIYGWREMRVNE